MSLSQNSQPQPSTAPPSGLPRHSSRSPSQAYEPTERVSWRECRRQMLDKFEQGQHMAIIGPTGEGKTTLAIDLLDQMYKEGMSELAFGNKPRDELLSELKERKGWSHITRWPPDYKHRQNRRIILWPAYGRASQAERKKYIFEEAMDYAYLEGGWLIYLDETRYYVEQLNMRKIIDEYWNGARSSKVTLMAGSQGTTWINKTMIRQETWLFLFRPRSVDEGKEFADAAGNPDLYHDLIRMQHHDFMVVHMPGGEHYVSRVGT